MEGSERGTVWGEGASVGGCSINWFRISLAPGKIQPWNMPSQSDERSCGRETEHNGGRWQKSWWHSGGRQEWGAHGGVTGVTENVSEVNETKTQRQIKCTVKRTQLPGNCRRPSRILDNDAVRCKISSACEHHHFTAFLMRLAANTHRQRCNIHQQIRFKSASTANEKVCE